MNPRLLKASYIIFFIFPYIVLLYFIKIINLNSIFNNEFFRALQNSFIQGIFSALIALGFGFFLSLGLLSFSLKLQNKIKKLLIIPVFLPSLFNVLVALSLVKPFPMGNWGVVLVMVLTYTGFVAATLYDEITQAMGKLSFISDLYQLSHFSFFYRVLIPQIRKNLFALGVLILLNVMVSFSVPLLVGGSKGSNLEILIYEKVFIDQNFSLALLLSLFQLVLTFLFFSSVQIFNSTSNSDSEFMNHKYYKSILGKALIYIFITFFAWGYLKLAIQSFLGANSLNFLNVDFIQALFNSMLMFFVTAVFYMILLFGVGYFFYKRTSVQFLNYFSHGSTIVSGFGLYLIFSKMAQSLDFIKLAVGLSILFFVSFYKLFFENIFQKFYNQFLLAQIYNMNYLEFIIHILFPQIKKNIHYGLSLLMIYVFLDFSVIKSTGASVQNLGVLMQSYLSSYRIEGAFLISLLSLLFWAFFSFLLGVIIDLYKRPQL